MARAQPKQPAKSEAENKAPPDLTLVEKTPQPEPAAKQPEAEQRAAKNQARRRLHPSRVWPD